MANPSVYLVSLGCAKNLVDSEVMLGSLLKANYPVENSPDQAEIIIVNTCAFIKAAQEEALETVMGLAVQKNFGQCNLLIVAGCLSQRYQRSLSKLLPEVDIFIGTGEFYRIVEIIEAYREKRVHSRFYLQNPLYLYDDTTPRVNASLPGSAFVKIAEGCSHRCSFCIIPKVRGRFRSRHPDSVIREVLNLSQQGIKEINLVAQDTTLYGRDLACPAQLASLLRRLAKIEGIAWIRLLYANPQNITVELLDVIREEKKVCKYLDLPLQHINREILKTMNRAHGPHSPVGLIEKIRSKIPGVTIRTTMMVGFPGETEAQFVELLDFIRLVKFDRLGAFTYSKEEGTLAAQLSHQVPEIIKEERRKILMAAQADISREKNQNLIGTVRNVLIEKSNKAGGLGRTASQAPEVDGITRVVSQDNLKAGEIYPILITDADIHDLKGTTLVS